MNPELMALLFARLSQERDPERPMQLRDDEGPSPLAATGLGAEILSALGPRPAFIPQDATSVGIRERPPAALNTSRALLSLIGAELPAPPSRGEPRIAFNPEGYRPELSEWLYRNVTPRSYGGPFAGEDRFAIARGLVQGVLTGTLPADSDRRRDETWQREDAWRLYLGLPQQGDTFVLADYTPGRSEDPDATYFKIKDGWEGIDEDFIMITDYEEGSNRVRGLPALIRKLRGAPNKKLVVESLDPRREVMANYTLGLGEDEHGHYISYYDIWDFDKDLLSQVYRDVPGIRKLKGLQDKVPGKPFEIYDRLYYDPETLEPIFPEEQESDKPRRPSERSARRP